VTNLHAHGRPGGGCTVGLAEDRSGNVRDPRPLVVHWVRSRVGALLGALADPVHSQADERKAAELAIDDLRRSWPLSQQSLLDGEALGDAVDLANDLVRKVAAEASGPAPARLSLTLLALHDGGLHWVSACDNGLFLLRDDELASLVEPGFRAVAAGAAYLGMEQPPILDQSRRLLPLRPGDRVLLCSRAVAAGLRPRQILTALRFDAQPAAEELVALAAPAAPGRARALVLAVAPAASAAEGALPDVGEIKGDAGAGLIEAAMSRLAALGLPRRPLWLAALLVGLLALVLAGLALLLSLRPSGPPAGPAASPGSTEPPAASAPLPTRALPEVARPPPPEDIAEPPPRRLQYRDMQRARD
jgi:hypothetical protein